MNKIHIAKRDTLPLYINIAIRGGAIILALLVCALVTTILTGENPLSIYGTILKGAFGTARKSWTTWENVAILLGISLAVTPAFKMRFWNIGAEGQVLIGCLASTTCMICLGGKMPNWLLLVVMTVASLAAGALWGFLPGFFKAKWNTNETLFTLMMNYIATQLVAYFIIIWEVPKGSGKIGIINQDTQAGWLPTIGNQKYLLAILVVAILTGLMYIYLNYSKHGYEIAVVGESRRTASYAGIKVDRVIIRTMALSGALCGLIGLLLTSSTDHTMTTTIVDGRGFTAVMVSWMAKFNPVIMIFVSLLLVVLSRGASEISTAFGLNRSFSAQKWSWLPAQAWMDAADEAQDREFHGDYEIWGGDIDPAAVELARHNAQLAEVDDIVRFEAADARTFHWGGMYGRIVTNPPYGERIMERREAEELYRAFGKAWTKFPETWKLYLLSSHTEFERTFGKTADRKRKLYNGMLKCDLFLYGVK